MFSRRYEPVPALSLFDVDFTRFDLKTVLLTPASAGEEI